MAVYVLVRSFSSGRGQFSQELKTRTDRGNTGARRMILHELSLLPSFTPVQRFSKQPSVARLTCGTIFEI